MAWAAIKVLMIRLRFFDAVDERIETVITMFENSVKISNFCTCQLAVYGNINAFHALIERSIKNSK